MDEESINPTTTTSEPIPIAGKIETDKDPSNSTSAPPKEGEGDSDSLITKAPSPNLQEVSQSVSVSSAVSVPPTDKDERERSASVNSLASSASASAPTTPILSTKKDKIDIILKPVGDAPILKQKRWSVDPDKQIGTIIQFIKNYLRVTGDQSLFVFVNQSFAPSPDQLIRNLYDCFGSENKLILHYSTTVAWG